MNDAYIFMDYAREQWCKVNKIPFLPRSVINQGPQAVASWWKTNSIRNTIGSGGTNNNGRLLSFSTSTAKAAVDLITNESNYESKTRLQKIALQGVGTIPTTSTTTTTTARWTFEDNGNEVDYSLAVFPTT
eukprot:UN10300